MSSEAAFVLKLLVTVMVAAGLSVVMRATAATPPVAHSAVLREAPF
jgi:hypothetical protein